MGAIGVVVVNVFDADRFAKRRKGLFSVVVLAGLVHHEEHAVKPGRVALELEPELPEGPCLGGDHDVVIKENGEISRGEHAFDHETGYTPEHVEPNRCPEDGSRGDREEYGDHHAPKAAKGFPAVALEVIALPFFSAIIGLKLFFSDNYILVRSILQIYIVRVGFYKLPTNPLKFVLWV